MRTSHLTTTTHGHRQLYRGIYKATPEMRTPPLIRTLDDIPRVAGIEEFYCIAYIYIPALQTL